MVLRYLVMALLVAGCSRGVAPPPSKPVEPDLKVVNQANPGQALDLRGELAADKATLVEFHSDHCEYSRQMVPVLEYLSRHKDDVAIRVIRIDRPEAREIDFESPVARQFDVHSVPSFQIYKDGKLTASGKEAKDQVRSWYATAQQFDRASQTQEGQQLLHQYEASPEPR